MRKKGFTLIELLAVIVILAIIALIAVPVILNVIEKSKESSAVDSAYGYIHAIENNLAIAEVKNGLVAEDKEYEDLREFEETYNINVKGTKPVSGKFTLNKRKVVSAEFKIDGYNIVCDKKKCESRGKNVTVPVTVTYNANGGTVDKTEDRVLTNSTLDLPTPTKNDYSFIGWYTEANGGEEVTNETPITSEMTLYAQYVKTINNFDYTGNVQEITLPKGKYKLEVWGAEGGLCAYNNVRGGYGGYSHGNLRLASSTNLLVYVGQKGQSNSNNISWNGGGKSDYGYSYPASGGGGTDISLQGTANSSTWNETKHLYSRIIVAGGGGAGTWSSNKIGGYGGGINSGGDSGYTAGQTFAGNLGSFGIGGNNTAANDSGGHPNGGGGGGWYGGGTKGFEGPYVSPGGGSGYVYTESTAANYPSGCLLDSSYYLTDAETISGNQVFLSPNGSNETGHTGNGYARITYLGKN